MSLAVASSSYRGPIEDKSLDLPALFLELHSIGARALELSSSDFANVTPAYLDELRSQSQRTGLTIRSLEVRSDFALSDPAERSRQVSDLLAWTDVAFALNLSLLHLHLGKPRPSLDPAMLARTLEDALGTLILQSRSPLLTIALDDRAGLLAPDALLEILHRLDSPRLRLAVDPDRLDLFPSDLVALVTVAFDDSPSSAGDALAHLSRLKSSPETLAVLHYLGRSNPTPVLASLVGRIS